MPVSILGPSKAIQYHRMAHDHKQDSKHNLLPWNYKRSIIRRGATATLIMRLACLPAEINVTSSRILRS
jgi:hypothetical protein